MARRAAITLHVALSALGVVLYVLFVIPRWWVLTGDFPVTLGAVGRIAAGIPIAAAAVPVVLNLQRAVKPGSATPELALRLRAWSAALHVLAGALILITALVEIWLPLNAAGPWLFAVYGAAGAIAVLAIAAFHLSFSAEQPPAPPKPPKAKKAKPKRDRKPKRHRDKAGTTASDAAGVDGETPEPPSDTETATETATEIEKVSETVAESVSESMSESVSEPVSETVDTTDRAAEKPHAPEEAPAETAVVDVDESGTAEDSADTSGGLRNKRPTGKVRHRLRR